MVSLSGGLGNVTLTGTPTTGQVIQATSPTTATWASGASQPWQLAPETYGAVADGKLAADFAISSGQPTLTTVGVVDPAGAPTVNHAGTGGTVLAGVYQVKITLVTPTGETLPSPSASTTTTGSTSTITVTAPAIVTGGAIGYHVYITAAGGSTYFRQTKAALPYPFQNNFVLFA